ncbi:Fis family transcriptional regulator [Geothermobacter hydrogeniphilus]|uniref:Fis family transcriptional regulator n=1 Tax=Geothermobacter hydrogeniphilus TaxID=1969733 RepID=A0A2K2H831_9BACT|nr:sigma 54-interacting transcriptional regulator [Geothermobacter hydrogeniphilus]PNU19409.1 Fis family transcriptional regulator [Geothermobacter hydrogeniphilus]
MPNQTVQLHPEMSEDVLNSLADGVFTVDRKLCITSFNRAAEEITGYRCDEVLGRPCKAVFASVACGTDCPVREALATGQPVINREFDILHKGGRKVPISISASVLRDAGGRIIGAVETIRDLSSLSSLKRELCTRYAFEEMISRSEKMRRLFDVLPDIAASNATVLVQGESGTGKELVARAVHNLSPRRDGPLVVVNCGALPEQLLEAEIFGARRGAYTGAVENRPGRLEMAEGGTLFLDEIGDLPLPLQVKLLRVLENHEYQPLGARQPQQADVRFVTATHRNIEQMVDRGTFRRDLYFRINVVSLCLPPLRERPEDIPLLVDCFLERLNLQYGKQIRGLAPAVLQQLLDYDYPGNVRELLNLLEQMVILGRNGELGPEHLPRGFVEHLSAQASPSRPARMPQREALIEMLDRHHGNRQQTAADLGVDRTTLWRWMKRYQLL